MKLTNLDNFPIPIRRYLENDSYDGGAMTDISATRLIDSPRISRLRSVYSHEIVEDSKRRIAAALGTAFHNMMEQYAPEDWVVEERFYATVDGKVVSGQIDALEPVDDKRASKALGRLVKQAVIIQDWKVITAYKAKSGMLDYEKQGNIYAFLCRENGYTPMSFNIWALIKDWKESEADRNLEYPQLPIMKYEYRLWDDDKCRQFITERVKHHFQKDLPECSEEEMWATDPKYLATKKGHSRPTKIFDSERDALNWIADGDHRSTAGTTYEDWDITIRPSERRRCENNWCNVAEVCDQFKKYKEEKAIG